VLPLNAFAKIPLKGRKSVEGVKKPKESIRKFLQVTILSKKGSKRNAAAPKKDNQKIQKNSLQFRSAYNKEKAEITEIEAKGGQNIFPSKTTS